MKMIQTTTGYTVPNTSEKVSVPFEYPDFGSSFTEAVEYFGGEAGALKALQQTAKEDCGNNSREKAKVANGHSTRPVMSEEAKAKSKAERQEISNLLKSARAKGISLADLKDLVSGQ